MKKAKKTTETEVKTEKKLSFYELLNFENIAEAEDVDQEEINKLLLEKTDRMAEFLDILSEHEEVAKNMKEKYAAKEKTLKNKQERLKNYILTAMQVTKKEVVKGELRSFRVMKKDSVEIVNESLIEPQFIKTEYVSKIDKKAIGEAMKMGEIVEGAELRANIFIKMY